MSGDKILRGLEQAVEFVKANASGPDFRNMDVRVFQRSIVADRNGVLWLIDPSCGEVSKPKTTQ